MSDISAWQRDYIQITSFWLPRDNLKTRYKMRNQFCCSRSAITIDFKGHRRNFSVMCTILTKFQSFGTCRTWNITSGPHYLSDLKIILTLWDSTGDVINEILLSCLQFWHDYQGVPLELEISSLVLVFYLVFKFYPSHVAAMMT